MARHRRLTHADRCQTYAVLQQGTTQQQVARHLGVSQGAISRELARNSDRAGYPIDQGRQQKRLLDSAAVHGRASSPAGCAARLRVCPETSAGRRNR